jgi:hypothetical protein
MVQRSHHICSQNHEIPTLIYKREKYRLQCWIFEDYLMIDMKPNSPYPTAKNIPWGKDNIPSITWAKNSNVNNQMSVIKNKIISNMQFAPNVNIETKISAEVHLL